ncbi:MAG: AbrB/MazE/SpoVT family DNA-binding domain-containing protein [Deltaproteobacteria bacterium]|nr:MAG: AbrB/MazE/SpoVT family DNA-binding domain-containing protein [Deltaproteobacteria bacterium]
MSQATLSGKYQIVIPKESRQAMALKVGDQLIVETIHGITLIIPKRKKVSEMLRGLSKGMFQEHYLKQERGSW